MYCYIEALIPGSVASSPEQSSQRCKYGSSMPIGPMKASRVVCSATIKSRCAVAQARHCLQSHARASLQLTGLPTTGTESTAAHCCPPMLPPNTIGDMTCGRCRASAHLIVCVQPGQCSSPHDPCLPASFSPGCGCWSGSACTAQYPG